MSFSIIIHANSSFVDGIDEGHVLYNLKNSIDKSVLHKAVCQSVKIYNRTDLNVLKKALILHFSEYSPMLLIVNNKQYLTRFF